MRELFLTLAGLVSIGLGLVAGMLPRTETLAIIGGGCALLAFVLVVAASGNVSVSRWGIRIQAALYLLLVGMSTGSIFLA